MFFMALPHESSMSAPYRVGVTETGERNQPANAILYPAPNATRLSWP
jgi:hypothetical protein